MLVLEQPVHYTAAPRQLPPRFDFAERARILTALLKSTRRAHAGPAKVFGGGELLR
jgi:hypothetical protein